MLNRFNRLTSKEWLPFQKSWFIHTHIEKLYTENIRFFVKGNNEPTAMYYYGNNEKIAKKICATEKVNFYTDNKKQDATYDFVLIDLLDIVTEKTTLKEYNAVKKNVIQLVENIYDAINHRKFVSILVSNVQIKNVYNVYAWDIAKQVATMLSLKDEKIGCIDNELMSNKAATYFTTSNKTFYSLYFRKDELSKGVFTEVKTNFFVHNKQQNANTKKFVGLPSWFILKPQPRKKNEILHPAKYPEQLAEMFINEFTEPNQNVLDPMSGTGSTQMAALKNNRNAYGTELSTFFADIAVARCKELLDAGLSQQKFSILNKDARLIGEKDFPAIHYIITSPPYWNMLNMKGAENQAKRVEKGLQTNYSDSKEDMGNIEDYNHFLEELVATYQKIFSLLTPGSYCTIVVKNIKKKGSNYPFAWDLSNMLQKDFILLPENFWCQNDISIAPFGYGNTWVSNTFHQYCLNFQIPVK